MLFRSLESTALSFLGGATGLIAGMGLAWVLKMVATDLPVSIPWPYVIGALILSGLIGLAAGVVPAMRAARLNPVDALRTE